MKKVILFLSLILFLGSAHAAQMEFAKAFKGKTGCFLLYNLNENKLVAEYNPTFCAKQLSPKSTFKIPLMLMAFDQKRIDQQTIFPWDGTQYDNPNWNHCQTTKTWMKYSVVWVSQWLTPKLGMEKIQHYLKLFHYGNENFSGTPGQDDALKNAWLSGGLLISANEQLEFLKALVSNTLPVSQQAMRDTKEDIFLEILPNGWKLYGKTGLGYPDRRVQEVPVNSVPQLGWFVGFMQKGNQTRVVVLDFIDDAKPDTAELAAPRAKEMAKEFLLQENK